MARVYPLSGAFMIVALLGLIFSSIVFSQTSGDIAEVPEGGIEIPDKGYDLDRTMLFTLIVLFGLMFIASLISMTFGPEVRN